MGKGEPEDIITVISVVGRPWQSPKEEAKALVEVVAPAVAKRWIRQRRLMTSGLERRTLEAVN